MAAVTFFSAMVPFIFSRIPLTLSFRLKESNKVGQIVIAEGSLALELEAVRDTLIGQTATVWGTFSDESYDKKHDDGKVEVIAFKVLHAERVQTPNGILPASSGPTEAPGDPASDAVDPIEAEIMALDF